MPHICDQTAATAKLTLNIKKAIYRKEIGMECPRLILHF